MTKKANGSGVTFEDLLRKTQEGANIDVESVKKELAELDRRRVELEEELAEVNRQAKSLSAQIHAPVRDAVKAAALLGIDVPGEYAAAAKKSNGGTRSNGSYLWQADGHDPFQAEPSRALWRISRSCGGSAGVNGEGVLTTEEFWALVKEQAGRESLELDTEVQVTLPNGKAVTVKKVA